MKQILIAIFLLGIVCSTAFSQTYRNKFDSIELQSYGGQGASFRSNVFFLFILLVLSFYNPTSICLKLLMIQNI
ncbi:MAG: hypothetical protein RJA07_2689 [Bacteroidota bacterium]|jgi:uncharacterized membrane protein YphA (DoxX/SURF4 family)